MRDKASAADLLRWYDRNARALPWRIGPTERCAGLKPNPYLVWLSEIMLQQTTVAAVIKYYQRFIELWPRVEDLADAPDEVVMGEWAGLGYYARARNLLKCARIVTEEYGASFPDTREELLKLPGIGPYTASAIAAIAYDLPETIVDGNVERVISRLFAVDTPLKDSKLVLTSLAADLTPSERPGDYAQAIMDLGATICTPRNPACAKCPWRSACEAHAMGRISEIPVKGSKKPKPVRWGIAYLARRSDGAWLLETRPDKGLLGGMLGWPGSAWAESSPIENPPLNANWRDPGDEVRHTFTHFHLQLRLRVAEVKLDAEPTSGQFVDKAKFDPSKLPTVMRKAHDLASNAMTVD
ncbi:MAG: A/G-specific adenine glycosylase [Boseongicola sp.]